jgi:hypothetical protein
MKLNIGSGYKRIEGFKNVDHDPLTNADYSFNLEDGRWPFEDSSIEEIRAFHILEHIGEGFLHVMSEIYRISKNGAIIDIAVPHHRHENYFGDPTHRRPITVQMLKQFSKKYCDWHKEYYGSSSGFAPRLKVDFEIVEFDYSVEGEYLELKEQGKFEELEALAKKFNNVYVDVYIKLVVIKE